jgi:serine/threonine protein kinase
MYIAPEVIQYKGHDKCADYWSWACIVFEMVTGKFPFYENDLDELELFNKIINGQFKIYGFMSYEARLLFISLFVPDPSKRLGASPSGWQDLANLSFFDCIDFKSLGRQTLPAPWVPDLHSPLDSCNFSGVKPDTPDKMNEAELTIDDELQAMFHAFGKVSMETA